MSRIDWDDFEWLKVVACPYFGIKRLRIDWSSSQKVYPDIRVKLGKMPVITVTREWLSQDKDSRRTRLVHEFLHLKGLEHGFHEGLYYSTFPKEDSYSAAVYQLIESKTKHKIKG